jgi:GT2 family glycosyltransferase
MTDATPPPRLGIILVNWRRPQDSIECLESVLRSSIPVQVAVIDNGSGDASLDQIAAWAEGRLPAAAASADMAHLITPPVAKPIAFERLSAAAAATHAPATGLTLIDAGRNGGFAAGNNIGLAHLRLADSIDYFWLLNNDTVIEPGTAGALLDHLDSSGGAGMCGTVVRFYWRPDRVQALNGHRFSHLTGASRGIGTNTAADTGFDTRQVVAQTDFVLGASLAISRDFLVNIGPMAEDYFLYFEEIDWAARNDGRFAIAFADKAVVFHKEGGSIGSSGIPGDRSSLSDYWLNRSRLVYVRRFHPLLLPWHWLLTMARIGLRLLRGQTAKAALLARALLGRPAADTKKLNTSFDTQL